MAEPSLTERLRSAADEEDLYSTYLTDLLSEAADRIDELEADNEEFLRRGTVLTIHPKLQFGEVCINHTRIPAASVAGCVAAGDSMESVADDYGITRDQLLWACWWYRWDCEGVRRKWEQAVALAWDDWADTAQKVLGGWEAGPCPDPPTVPM